MMRTWILRAVAVLIAVAVAGSVLRASPPEPTSTDDKLNLILDRLGGLETKLGTMQAGQNLQSLQIKAMQDEIDRLKSDLTRLSDDYRRAAPVTPNVAASINPNAPVAVPLTTSRIVLENLYSSPATIVVNGQTYRVMPLERMTLPATVGAFTYAVYTDNYGLVQGLTSRYLTAGRDFPITINPIP